MSITCFVARESLLFIIYLSIYLFDRFYLTYCVAEEYEVRFVTSSVYCRIIFYLRLTLSGYLSMAYYVAKKSRLFFYLLDHCPTV